MTLYASSPSSGLTACAAVLTVGWAVLVLSAGPGVSGRARAGSHGGAGDGLAHCELELHLLGLRESETKTNVSKLSLRTGGGQDRDIMSNRNLLPQRKNKSFKKNGWKYSE